MPSPKNILVTALIAILAVAIFNKVAPASLKSLLS